MSRLSKIVENPAIKSLKWKNEKSETVLDAKNKPVKNEKGQVEKKVTRKTGWYYYDKNLNEGEGGEVLVEMPLSFIWLESAFSIMGYNKDKETGIYSNEVLDTKTQRLEVKIGKDIVKEGLYANIKDGVKGLGGKFCSVVYALAEIDGKEEIVRFLLSGSGNSAWIEFSNRAKNKNFGIVSYDTKYKTTPTGDGYEEPVFKYVPLSDEKSKQADVAAAQVDEFFNYYLNKPKETLVAAGTDDEFDDGYSEGDN